MGTLVEVGSSTQKMGNGLTTWRLGRAIVKKGICKSHLTQRARPKRGEVEIKGGGGGGGHRKLEGGGKKRELPVRGTKEIHRGGGANKGGKKSTEECIMGKPVESGEPGWEGNYR